MKQYTLLTVSGINKLLKTASDGSKIALKEVVVSDFDGELSEQTTSIPNEKYRGAINAVTIDESDSNILDVDVVIPPEVGGFYIKTAGIYCDDGSLFAVARLADTYKPLLNEGSSKDITLNFKLQIANASESVILKVDNNVVLATRKWSDATFLKKTDKIDAYTKKESDKKFAPKDDLPPFATEAKSGIVKLKNSITAKQEDVAVTEKAVAEVIEVNKSIGINQTWQDVKDQRQAGVTYTNTTERPIFVIVIGSLNHKQAARPFLVNGIKIGDIYGHDGTANTSSLCFIVPPKGTYKADFSPTIGVLYSWAEFR
ncbi:phage tail protein [Campylobacter concisus]|uniref:phage tail protein n=1 Tax=Campylobacter concisus TaxID=199 RepID=UPI000CD97F70|nr:phage tail protein [Campylobacter concisus]